MPLDPAANFIRGTTDSSVASTDTAISVADASIFPDPGSQGEYNLVCWDDGTHPRPDQDDNVEIVRVTGRDTTTDELTVARGQEGTSDVFHPSGSALQMSPTAKMFGDIDSEFNAFWDATNAELTADVNNSTVSTGKVAHKSDVRDLALKTRTDLRPSVTDSADLWLDVPGWDSALDIQKTDVIWPNGVQLDVRLDPDEVSSITEKTTSERLKFLRDGAFALETAVQDKNLELQSESGGGILAQTTDGQNSGKNKVDRLKINGGQNSLETAEWQNMDYVRFAEFGAENQNTQAGRIYLGLNSNDSEYGVKFEWTGSRFQAQIDANDYQFLDPSSNPIAELGGDEVRIFNRIDIQGNKLRGNGATSRLRIDDFAKLPPRSSAPSSPETGDVACQDGTNWDPAGTGNDEIIAYVNGTWTQMT